MLNCIFIFKYIQNEGSVYYILIHMHIIPVQYIHYSSKRKYNRYYMENTTISFTAIVYSIETKYRVYMTSPLTWPFVSKQYYK